MLGPSDFGSSGDRSPVHVSRASTRPGRDVTGLGMGLLGLPGWFTGLMVVVVVGGGRIPTLPPPP